MNVPRLSEAILLGIGAVRENRDVFLAGTSHDPCGCALGTALFIVGEKPTAEGIDLTHKYWPWTRMEVQCPDGEKFPSLVFPSKLWTCDYVDHRFRTVANIISHLHYNHHWTRERIADWVATIEPQEDAHGTDDQATASRLSVPESLERQATEAKCVPAQP